MRHVYANVWRIDSSVPMESMASLVKVLVIELLCKAMNRHFR